MSALTPELPFRPCLLIYDGQCRLCVTAQKGLERLGTDSGVNQIHMITYKSKEASAVLGADYRPGLPDAPYLVCSNGEVAHGLGAFLPRLPGLKGGWILALPLRLQWGLLAACPYRLVVRYRYRCFGEESRWTQPADIS